MRGLLSCLLTCAACPFTCYVLCIQISGLRQKADRVNSTHIDHGGEYYRHGLHPPHANECIHCPPVSKCVRRGHYPPSEWLSNICCAASALLILCSMQPSYTGTFNNGMCVESIIHCRKHQQLSKVFFLLFFFVVCFDFLLGLHLLENGGEQRL